MPTFKEWLREKDQKSRQDGRVQRLKEWVDAYQRLTDQLLGWLKEEGEEYVNIGKYPVLRGEQGLGSYELLAYVIHVGDQAVEIQPGGRNVIARISLHGEPERRAAGYAEISDQNGVRKYTLYRLIEDDRDVWCVMDDRYSVSPLTKERFQEILMDLMS